jgi:hypothetical protein
LWTDHADDDADAILLPRKCMDSFRENPADLGIAENGPTLLTCYWSWRIRGMQRRR